MHMRKTLNGNQRLQGGHHDDHEHAMRRPEHKHEQHEKKTPFGVSEHLNHMRMRQTTSCAARGCGDCGDLEDLLLLERVIRHQPFAITIATDIAIATATATCLATGIPVVHSTQGQSKRVRAAPMLQPPLLPISW